MADAKGFRIKIDEANYQAVIDGMRAITWRSEESVFSSAINKTAKHAQVWWTDEIKRVYIGEWPKGVLARSSIKPSTAANVGATIDFKSGIPGLKKFRATPAQTPTRFSRSQPKTWRKLAIKIGGEEQYRSYSFSNSLTDIAAIYEYNFLPYGTAEEDGDLAERSGGMGSTGK